MINWTRFTRDEDGEVRPRSDFYAKEPIVNCAFCGEPATRKAADNTPLCDDCATMYRPAKEQP